MAPTCAKIFVNWAQVTSYAAMLELSWPEEVESFFEIQETVSSPLPVQTTSLGCALTQKGAPDKIYYMQMRLMIWLPVVVIAASAFMWTNIALIGFMRKACKEKRICIPNPFQLKDLVVEYTPNFLVTVMVILFLVHGTITKTLFNVLNCETVDPGERWLRTDMTIQCGTREHTLNVFLAVAFMIAWVFCIPATGALVLWSKRASICFEPGLPSTYHGKLKRYAVKKPEEVDELGYDDAPFYDELPEDLKEKMTKKKQADNEKFGFLFKGFEQNPVAILWECSAIMMRKILMIAVVVFLSNSGVQIQIMMLLFMLVIAIVLHTRYQPFEIDELDSLEMWSLLSSYFTMFFGMFFTTGIRGSVDQAILDIFTWIIIVMNILTFIKFLQCAYIAAKVMTETLNVKEKSKAALTKAQKVGGGTKKLGGKSKVAPDSGAGTSAPDSGAGTSAEASSSQAAPPSGKATVAPEPAEEDKDKKAD